MTPDWLLERYALGEATAEERARVQADPDLAKQLSALELSTTEIHALHPRLRERPKTQSAWSFWLLPVAAACAVALAVSAPSEEDVRAKGNRTALLIYRATPTGPQRLAPNAPCEKGDRLQIEYTAGAARFGAIFSIDGRGHVTQHWPEGDSAAALEPHALLPFAYELDDAPAFERFVFIYGPKSFALSGLGQALVSDARLPVGETVFTVTKP